MNGAEVILALAAGLSAVWYGLYVTGLVLLSRRYRDFADYNAQRLAESARTRTRPSILEAFEAAFALCWSTSLALVLAPLLLIVVPILLGIGALLVTGDLVHVR